ncbi:ethanolamine kinase 1 [Stemphylium lycopersici]|uniref:Sterol regulatory element-binding protein cleavage-activating protein n=1 Tax=Stemphylium lycopersici TaxID=183478 RepID=A0A364N309_STELY|nr:ethanolamine kinase 1 [Stemphylium lycopersici]
MPIDAAPQCPREVRVKLRHRPPTVSAFIRAFRPLLAPTTEPPRLSTAHPIRRAFQAHGTATARHWLLSIVLTITISVLFCYQAIFQADSSAAAGLRNLPKHVWTSTTQVEGERPADVVVRQVWIHGDYMDAIKLPVLREALQVQQALINGGFESAKANVPYTDQDLLARSQSGCLAAGPGENWGWHSPLMYWNCSLSALEHDPNLLETINARTRTHTPLNITLRPSTVFAGKSFSHTKLCAADALVITLFDQTNSTVGDVWNARARHLAEEISPDWTVFPSDGQVMHSRLFEFTFKPMTLNDDLFLAASYLITAAYVIWKMKQLRAVKSWFGLLVTICVKMTICVIASFTLCTYLGIDLARIPRPWFPGVVFCFGLGNIFRLINVVLETPPEMPPHQRIGNALGEVGHLSLAIAFQNLALLYFCSRFVAPWVADFCVFAAVTLVFDLVFHLTFFVAVLSVDVQRMELSDSLDRIDFNQNRTVAIFSIILAINWHFFDSSGKQLSLTTLRQSLTSRRQKRAVDATWSPPPINQARTPADWLRLQDHNTARELFSFIKPGAQTFTARIYNPILVVAKGAYGRDRPQPPSSLMEGLRRFAHGHAFPVALMVVMLIATVTLLMNYLLWNGLPAAPEETNEEDNELSVKTLPAPQNLDVAQLAACPKGHLASVSLDRSTALWLQGRGGYLHATLQTAVMKPKLWPIYSTAMDDGGSMLAICGQTGQIGLWDIPASRFLMFPQIDIRGQVPMLFAFVTLKTRTDVDRLYLIVVIPDGHLTKLEARTGIHHTRRISPSSILCSSIYTSGKDDTSLVFVTKPGEVHILSLKENNYTSEVVAGLDPGPPPGSNPAKIRCIHGVPSLGLIFALRDEEAEIFDFASRALVHAFQIGHIRPHSFRVLHSVRRVCQCGAPAVNSLSVAYAEQDTNHMMMQTFCLDDKMSSQMCLGKPLDREKHRCRGLECAKETIHSVEPAGSWESTDVLSVIGIRRREQSPTPSSTSSSGEDDQQGVDAGALASAIKQRAQRQGSPSASKFADKAFIRHDCVESSIGDTDGWEAWTLSTTGDFRSRPLTPDDVDDEATVPYEEELFVAAPGPTVRLGKRSIAVGFGNTVKVITLGKESLDGLTKVQSGAMDTGLGSYKWRARKDNGRKVQTGEVERAHAHATQRAAPPWAVQLETAARPLRSPSLFAAQQTLIVAPKYCCLQLYYDNSDSHNSALNLILALRPEWRDSKDTIEFVRFTDGITNTLLKAVNNLPGLSKTEVDDDAILLRAYGKGTDVLIDREKETRSHSLLARHNLAPALYARFENGLLYKYIQGSVCTPADLRRPEVWRGVAQRLGEWHATLPISSISSICPAPAQLTSQHNKRESLAAMATLTPGKPIPNVWTTMQKWILALPIDTTAQSERRDQLMHELDSLTKLLADTPGIGGSNPFVFAHCDLLSGNVIIEPSSSSASASRRSSASSGSDESEAAACVSFIDYEYATPAPASFDIANHFAEWGGFDCDYSAMPTRNIRRAFLREYLRSFSAHQNKSYNESELEELFEQVDRFRGVPGFYWGIWALIQAQISLIEFDYATYAEIRLGEYFAWKKSLDGGKEEDNERMMLREKIWAQEE